VTGRTRIWLGLVILVGALAAAATASAAPPISVEAAKHKDGPYSKFDSVPVTVRHERDLFLRVTSNGSTHDVALFDQKCCDGSHDYRVRYFRGQNNVTQDARSDEGAHFNVAFGAPKLVRIEIEPRVAQPDAFCLYPYATADDQLTEYTAYFAVNNPSACV
jgi:hypothetical protein